MLDLVGCASAPRQFEPMTNCVFLLDGTLSCREPSGTVMIIKATDPYVLGLECHLVDEFLRFSATCHEQ